ncbi:MAG: glycosyltransferase [Chloroflexi bacterium]|nr:glycosyltransferase [Chloroflexota bacterium]MCY3581018.1 glycosyltransferase [Chloroflexota bacterium]MCY3715207.1 glycosyltransferase [Chloroflexota bacterium]MDE2649978.1 glycosyltransferase [Chloroflexota bacterium]
MKLALVHDWLNQIGGAEDVLEVLARQYPASPIFTSIFAPAVMPPHYQAWDIRRLWLDKLPAIHRRHQLYLPLYPLAWGKLRLHDYDVILSNKSGFCHGLRHDPRALHICYCLTPARYVWQLDDYLAGEGLGKTTERLLRPLVAWLRRWDFAAAQRVSYFIAISSAVQARIRSYYQRESTIIHPPVDTSRFQPCAAGDVQDYYLIVSRLVPYKRIDLAVRAATELGLPLKIAGAGRDLARLKTLAGATVEFLGFVPAADLSPLMARCRALLFPGLEDFGITPVQAQAAGRPVIAYRGGGALDTIIVGETGEFFDQPTVDSLKATWRNFDAFAYNPRQIRSQAQRFDTSAFCRRMQAFIDEAWAAHRDKRSYHFDDPVATAERGKP